MYFGTKGRVNLTLRTSLRGRDCLESYLTELLGNRSIDARLEILGNDNSRYGSIYKVIFSQEYIGTLEDNSLCIRDWMGNPVTQLLVKVGFISDRQRSIVGGKETVSQSDWNSEVEIQKHVYNTTNTHFQPITPLIYAHYVLDNEQKKRELCDSFSALSHTNERTSEKVGELRELSSNNSIHLGIIIMEMREGFRTLMEFDGSNSRNRIGDGSCNNPHILGMVSEVLFRLHNTCGILHNDLHKGNILYNPDIIQYYNPLHGGMLLIDFGLSGNIAHAQPYGDPDPERSVRLELSNVPRSRDPSNRRYVNGIWWSYYWLLELPWNSMDVQRKYTELRHNRIKNYKNPSDLPDYFYQPYQKLRTGFVGGYSQERWSSLYCSP